MTIDATPQPPAADPSLDEEILGTLGLSSDTNSEPAAAAPSEAPAPAHEASAEPGAAVGSAPAAPVTPEPSSAPEPAAPAPTEGAPQGTNVPSSAPSEPPAAAPTASEAALRQASLEATNDALRRELEALRANPKAAEPTATPTPAPSPDVAGQEKPFVYGLTLPQQTKDALTSDDPEKNIAAIEAIVNTLGTVVHNTVLTQVRNEVKGMLTTLGSMASSGDAAQSEQQARETAREAYFKDFPTHKNELIEPIIRSESLKLSAEYPNLPFNEQYRAALGARVNAALEKLGAKPPEGDPTPPSTPPNTPPVKPAGHLPNGTRGPGITPTPESNLGEDIFGTLSLI